MTDDASATVEKKTSAIILGACSIGLTLFIPLAIFEFLTPEAPLLGESRTWAFSSIVSLFIVLLVAFLIGLRILASRGALYCFAVPCVFAVFCLVNVSGGLTNSPFLALYPGILTIAIVISNRPRPVMFTGTLIAICLALNGVLQLHELTPLIKSKYPYLYHAKYYLTNLLTLTLMGIADYISHKYPDVWIARHLEKL
jgi:hypothetical protein